MPDCQTSRTDLCFEFIVRGIARHDERWSGKQKPPLFVGINGVQGIGKSKLVGTALRLELLYKVVRQRLEEGGVVKTVGCSDYFIGIVDPAITVRCAI